MDKREEKSGTEGRRVEEREEESGVEGGGERGRRRMRNGEREKYESELEESGVEGGERGRESRQVE